MGWFVGWAFGGCVWGGRFNRRRCLHAHQVFFKIFILTQVFFTGPCASETRSSEITPISAAARKQDAQGARTHEHRDDPLASSGRAVGGKTPAERTPSCCLMGTVICFMILSATSCMRTPFPRQYHRSQQTLRLLTLALAVHCWPAWQLKQESRP